MTQRAAGALARELGERLLAEGLFLATAESCTGGLVAGEITAVAGSSEWFERGFVTYSNEAKFEMLGVPPAIIATHGAVSEPVARAMAEGALAHSHADAALAVTGIAGPGGGSADKPVGTVWFAWASRGTPTTSALHVLPGDRDAVREASVLLALAGAVRQMSGKRAANERQMSGNGPATEE